MFLVYLPDPLQLRMLLDNVVGDTPIHKRLKLLRWTFDGLYLPIKMSWIFFFSLIALFVQNLGPDKVGGGKMVDYPLPCVQY